MEAIVALAENESRDLSEDEEKEYGDLEKQAKAKKKELDRLASLKKIREELNKGAKPAEQVLNPEKTEEPEITAGGNKAESNEARDEFTANIYRAVLAPKLDAVSRQKMLEDSVVKLAEGGHYKGFKFKNAVDAFSTLTDDKGGIFLPTTISNEIMSIALEYGVFPAQSMRMPLQVGSSVKIPNYTGSFTFYAVNEGSEVASSTTSFKGIQLKDNKWMCIVPWTNELDAAAASKLVPIINLKLGEGWAGTIDQAVINGDGTSTYWNKVGFISRAASATYPEVITATAATGHNTYAEIDDVDLTNGSLSVAPGIRQRGVYVFHPDWDVRLAQIKDLNGVPIYRSGGLIAKNGNQWFINGRPVYFTEKMPNTDGASKNYGLFYVPSYLAFGEAGAFMAEQLTEASILASDGATRIYLGSQDMRALRVKGFFDFEFSPLVSDSLGAFAVLETAST